MARITKADLQDRVWHLAAYQEAWFCRHENPVVVESGPHTFYLVGLSRASGGVAWAENSANHVVWIETLCTALSVRSDDAYTRDLASKIRRAQHEAIQGEKKTRAAE